MHGRMHSVKFLGFWVVVAMGLDKCVYVAGPCHVVA